MRRTPLKPVRSSPGPTYSVRQQVMLRDGGCLMARFDPAHVCRDAYGTPHAPDALNRLTAEHVKEHLTYGQRAPSDVRHLVALCWQANVGVPSKEARAFFREYLAQVEPS